MTWIVKQSAAAMMLALAVLPACAPVSPSADAIASDASGVASNLALICQTLVPAVEATATALAKGGAATILQTTENDFVTPACAAANALGDGWLADVMADMIFSGTAGQQNPAAASPGGGH
ncbi:MAG TPA: hypothetical protein VIJ42_10620 [Stellaceae bacterium]